jgi:O-succinylhomoserine sulfhydrylase
MSNRIRKVSGSSQTKAVRNRIENKGHKEHSQPIFVTSSFEFDSAEEMRAAFADENDNNIYSRFSNPNADELVARMCALENTPAGFATASGMAAVFASVMALCKSGDHIISCSSVFGSTHTLFTKFFPRWGITTSYFDASRPEQIEKLLTPNTRMVFVETPTNPGLDVIDLEWLGKFCSNHNLILNVDNCFATPVLQKPADYGATLVTHSATKFIDGQGRVLGGLVLGREDLIKEVYLFCRSSGPAISPFNAWVLSKSLETLEVRMDRHSSSALRLAEWLEFRNDLSRVIYPFLKGHPQFEIAKRQMRAGGGVVSFELNGDAKRGARFLDDLSLCSLTANLGDTRTIASHPASTTHAKLTEEERLKVGITSGLVRISVGLEDPGDIIADIENALNKSK